MMNPNVCDCPKCRALREEEDPQLAKAVDIVTGTFRKHDYADIEELEEKIVSGIADVIDKHYDPICKDLEKQLKDMNADEEIKRLVWEFIDAAQTYHVAKPLLNKMGHRGWSLGDAARYVVESMQEATRAAQQRLMRPFLKKLHDEALNEAAKSVSENN